MSAHLGEDIDIEEERWREEAKLCIDLKSNGYYGEIEHDYSPISFCPWCGEKIELIQQHVTKMVKKTKIVQETRTETFYEEQSE